MLAPSDLTALGKNRQRAQPLLLGACDREMYPANDRRYARLDRRSDRSTAAPRGAEPDGQIVDGAETASLRYLKIFQKAEPTFRCRPDFVHGIPVARDTLRFAFVIPRARFQLNPPLFIAHAPSTSPRLP